MQYAADLTDDDPLLREYHRIRWVPESDAPWPGMLVRSPDGESRVLVDVQLLGADWPGWRAEPGGHVLGPTDVVRRHDGHDAAMPVCTERVDAFLARRTGRDPRGGLDDGEVVTLAVSLLRGAAESARTLGGADGEWWLTDEGRPVLALVSNVRAPSTGELLETLAETTRGRLVEPLRLSIEAVADARTLLRDLDRLESDLFRAADPRPLAFHASAQLEPRAAIEPLRRQAPEEASPRWFEAIARHADADLGALASDLTKRAWRRFARPKASAADRPRSRRRPWLVAAVVGAGIVGIGLAWPTGGGPATADSDDAALAVPDASSAAADPDEGRVATETPSAGADPESPTGGTTTVADWVTVTGELLTRRTTCGGDAACIADVAEDPSRTFPAGVIDASPSDRAISLLDEFGGAAVLRVDRTDGSGAGQLVVVVRTDGRLLLRDVHDIAEQEG